MSRNNALFTYHFPDFPISQQHHNDTIKSNYAATSQRVPPNSKWLLSPKINSIMTHSSHRDYKPPPTPPSTRLSFRLLHILLGNDNTLDQFHTSASEELPVISTRQSRAHLHNHNQSLPQPAQRSLLARTTHTGHNTQTHTLHYAPPEAALLLLPK